MANGCRTLATNGQMPPILKGTLTAIRRATIIFANCGCLFRQSKQRKSRMYHWRLKGSPFEIGTKIGNIFKRCNAEFPIVLDDFQLNYGSFYRCSVRLPGLYPLKAGCSSLSAIQFLYSLLSSSSARLPFVSYPRASKERAVRLLQRRYFLCPYHREWLPNACRAPDTV